VDYGLLISVAYSTPASGRCLLYRADIYSKEAIRQVELEIGQLGTSLRTQLQSVQGPAGN